MPLDLPFLGLEGRAPYTPIVVGFCATVWTPILAAVHQWGMTALGPLPDVAVEDSDNVDDFSDPYDR